MELINNLLLNLGAKENKIFKESFENFQEKIEQLEPDFAKSVLNVTKAEISKYANLRSFEVKSLVIKTTVGESKEVIISLEDYLKDEYSSSDFTVAVRCDMITNYCTSFFEQDSPSIEPIIWNGELKRFGAIIISLVEGGYIEIGKLNTGKFNFNRLSKLVLKHFKFENMPDQVYLSKVLNSENNKFDDVFYKQVKIPNRVTRV